MPSSASDHDRRVPVLVDPTHQSLTGLPQVVAGTVDPLNRCRLVSRLKVAIRAID